MQAVLFTFLQSKESSNWLQVAPADASNEAEDVESL
jgi:hypothetical protein